MTRQTIKGARALVTGATGGLGQAIARALHAEGAELSGGGGDCDGHWSSFRCAGGPRRQRRTYTNESLVPTVGKYYPTVRMGSHGGA